MLASISMPTYRMQEDSQHPKEIITGEKRERVKASSKVEKRK